MQVHRLMVKTILFQAIQLVSKEGVRDVCIYPTPMLHAECDTVNP